MLEGIRKFSMSPVGKVIFVVVLIAFGAGFWYVGDPGASYGTWAVRVGDVSIRPETVADEYRRELQRLRMAGTDVDADQARALGVPEAVTSRLVSRTLLDAEARDLGLTASDARLRAQITENPAFRGAGGVFDRQVYTELLRQNGFSERAYEEIIRAEVARSQYISAIQSGVAVPRPMAEALFQVVREQRVARVVSLAAANMPAPPPTDEAKLREWYDSHPADYTAPETRTVSAVLLRVEAIAETIEVSDAEVAAGYEEYIDQFTAPEQRTLRQMIIGDEAVALRAHARLLEGGDFATVAAEEAGLPADGLELGSVTRTTLLPGVADIAFSLDVGEISEPIQSLLGWHIVAVDAIAEPVAEPLDAVRDRVRDMVASDKAVDELVALATSLDDALGGGAGLESAAADLALTAERIGPFDANGRDPEGQPIAGLQDIVVQTAFETEVGMESLLTDLPDDGSFVLRVDDVTPSALRPFESVRNEVEAAVIASERLTAAEAEAERLVERANAGTDLATIAGDDGLSVTTTQPFRRDGSGAGVPLPRPLISVLFAAEPNTPVHVTTGDTVWIGEVTEVIAADPVADATGMAAVETTLENAIREEILNQLVSGLQSRHPVSVNQQVLDQIF